MRFVPFATLAVVLTLTGCHSAWMDATIINRTSQTLSNVEVDYPSASFGTQTLAPGADFHYRFKVLGSGPTAILWTDPAHQDHKTAGPAMQEGDEGALTVVITSNGASWDVHPLKR